MKFNKKYLGIFSCIFIICTIFILYEYRPGISPIQEGLTIKNSGTNVGNAPNSVIPNSVSSVVVDPSQFSGSALSDTSNFKVTSSNNLTKTNADVTNSMDVISSGAPDCDSNTAYSMKSVMQDDNGNIIIRYMDTCGKYYTYQYSQTINKIQNKVTPPVAAPPAAVESAKAAAVTAAEPPPKTNNISVTIDSSTINDIITKALSTAESTAKGTPPPVVYPT